MFENLRMTISLSPILKLQIELAAFQIPYGTFIGLKRANKFRFWMRQGLIPLAPFSVPRVVKMCNNR